LNLKITLYRLRRNAPGSADIVKTGPHAGKSALQTGELAAQFESGVSLDTVHDLMRRNRGRKATKEVYVVRLHREIKHLATQLIRFLDDKLSEAPGHCARKDLATELRCPHEVVINVIRGMTSSLLSHAQSI